MADPIVAVLRNIGVPVDVYVLDADGNQKADNLGQPLTKQAHLRFTANRCADLEELWPQDTVVESVPVFDAELLDRFRVRHDEWTLAKNIAATAGNPAPAEPQPPTPLSYRQLTKTVYGVDAWQSALQRHAATTVRRTMALLLGYLEVPCTPDAEQKALRTAGNALIESKMQDYAMAIGAAFAMAQGLDPESAGKTLAAGRRQAAKRAAALMADLVRALDEEDTEPAPETTVNDDDLESLSGPGTNGSASGHGPPWPATEDLVVLSPSSGN